MTSRRVLLSWSGGKDSALALEMLRADPDVEVVGLLTSVTREYDRISIHGVRRSLLDAQAASLALPLLTSSSTHSPPTTSTRAHSIRRSRPCGGSGPTSTR